MAELPKEKPGVLVELPKRPPEGGADVVVAWPEAAVEAGWPKLKESGAISPDASVVLSD